MGKTLDALLGRRFKTSKFKAIASLAISRLTVLKNQRQARCSIARSDVVGFLKSDNHDRALLRVEQVIKEQNMFDMFVILEGYCHLLIERVDLFEQEKDCPEDLVEGVSSLIYASVRCGEFPELEQLRVIFTSRFGKEFAARAVELRNNCGVNPKIIQKLSTRMPSLENKMKVLKEIASDNNIDLPMEETSPDTTLGNKEAEKEKQLQEAGLSGRERNESDDERERRPIVMNYKDVATAAQAAFESAAHAAAAARAAVVLSRSDPHHPPPLYPREDLIEPTTKATNHEDPQENEHVQNNDFSGGTLLRRSFSGSISDSSSDDEDEIKQGNEAFDHESDDDDKKIGDREERGGFEWKMEEKISGGAEPLKINRNPISVRTRLARGR